jgi:hypothetical protein
VAVDRDVRAGSRREREVTPKDRRPSLEGDVLQEHTFALAMTDHGPAPGGPNVPHPACRLTEHGDEVALTLPVGDHHRAGEEAAAAPSHHLETGSAPGSDPSPEDQRPRPVLESGEGTGASAPVQPAPVGGMPAHGVAFPEAVAGAVTAAGFPAPWVRSSSTSIVPGLWMSASQGTPWIEMFQPAKGKEMSAST